MANKLKNLPLAFDGDYSISDDILHNFPVESKKYMVVDDNSFQVMKDGKLNVTLANGNSKIFGKAQYCLEYVIKKCNYTTLNW